MRDFRRLDIWKDSIELTDKIYDITINFPKHEIYGLSQQINNAAVSIPSNIAEGSGRSSDKEYARFLEFSLGSGYELETQLIIAKRRKYYDDEQIIPNLTSIQKRISSFIKVLKRNKK